MISGSHLCDILRCGRLPSGPFTLKEAYSIIRDYPNMVRDIIWTPIWSGVWWSKISAFLWLIAWCILLTWDRIKWKGFEGSSLCFLCHQAEENSDHLFLSCKFSLEVWAILPGIFSITQLKYESINTVFNQWYLTKFKTSYCH